MIKRFEAKTLEEACAIASKDLECSVDKLDYDIMQYPSKGFLGLFAKKAIIVVVIKEEKQTPKEKKEEPKIDIVDKSKKESHKEAISTKKEQKNESTKLDDSAVLDSFYNEKPVVKEEDKKESIDAQSLEEEIKRLFKNSCFNLDTIEVDIDENTAYVFIDGNDAALLIGKEGYRYNALSYLLFNWINSKYGLYLKLEIAQFLASQQDMIVHQLKPVVEHVNKEGWGRTRELNGILVQIALEYLRDTFPNKYVAIKRSKNGERYIVINEFNKR